MAQAATFVRDRATWTGYGLIGVWAFFLYFIGPGATAITEDLGLPETASGFIGTALAVGLITAAFLGPILVRRAGRVRALIFALVAMAALAVLLALSPGYPAVLLAVAGLGLTGVSVTNGATATLSDLHPGARARAITEGNAAAAWLGVAAPAVLGFCLALPTGWRGAAVVVGLLAILAVIPARSLPAPPPPPEPPRPGSSAAPMSRTFWLALIVVAMAVSMEFSVNFWAAALIGDRTGASLATSATALSAMTLGLALGRTFLASLANRFPLPALLTGFFLVAGAGLAVLLTAAAMPMSVVGLLITGIGLSVLFPFAQSQAIALAPDRTDRAVALTSLAVGLAVGIAPFVLGLLANALSLEIAFSLGFLLAAVGIGATAAVALADRR